MDKIKFNFTTLQSIINKQTNMNLTQLPNIISNYLDYLKNGGKIHIKKENRGKFTESAKRAGRTVQEHARAVLANPNATALQKKRANFAIQAKRWHHK